MLLLAWNLALLERCRFLPVQDKASWAKYPTDTMIRRKLAQRQGVKSALNH